MLQDEFIAHQFYFDPSVHPVDGVGGVMFSGCPSDCVCVHTCMRWSHSSDRFAANFSSLIMSYFSFFYLRCAVGFAYVLSV